MSKVYVNTSTKLKGRGFIHAGEHDLTKEEIKTLKDQGFIGDDKPVAEVANDEALKAEVTRLSGELETCKKEAQSEVSRLSGDLDDLKIKFDELSATAENKPADLTK